jgi:hypothetical protein
MNNDRCPPHNFQTAWISDEKGGAIFCRWCGEVRELEVPTIEAPVEERVNARSQAPDS